MTKAQLLAVGSTAELESGGEQGLLTFEFLEGSSKKARSLSWPRSGQAHAAAVLAVPGRHPSHGPIGQVGGGGSGGQLARQVTRRGESERRRVNLARG